MASSTDREQFTRYSRVLKGIAPNDLDAFCKMKYNNTDEWNKLKKQYRVVNQYKIDSGDVSPKQILELDSKIITEKRNNFTSRYKSSGNIAGAFVDDKKDNIVISHSRIGTTTEMNKYKGNYTIVGLADNRQFNYIDVMLSDGSTRTGTYNDSEAKLFEYLAREYQTSQFKTITLLSERGMCDSCIGVMKQFEEQYGVKINAVSNKKVEGNVWKYRGKKK